LLAIWFSGSRGPWLGLLAGMFFWLTMSSLAFQRRLAFLVVLGAASTMGAFLITLNIANGPLEPLRNTASLKRLSALFETKEGSGRERLLVWSGTAKMVLPHEPILFSADQPDPFNIVRPLVGYGPESLSIAYYHFLPPELDVYAKHVDLIDRSHNEVFDALVTTGVLGLLSYLVVFTTVIYYGLKWAGLIPPGRKLLWVGLYGGGGLLGAMAAVVWGSPVYFGIGLPAGLLIGLLAYLAHFAIAPTQPESFNWDKPLSLALLGACLAHFVEIQFGIATVSTRLYFWAYAGVLAAVGWMTMTNMTAAEPKVRSEGKKSRRVDTRAGKNPLAPVLPTIIVSLILITLSYALLSGPHGVTLESMLTVADRPSLYTLLLFGCVWLATVAILHNTLKSAMLTLSGSIGIWLVFAILHSSVLSGIAARRVSSEIDVLESAISVSWMFILLEIWIAIMLIAGAIALIPHEAPASANNSQRQAAWALIAFATAGAIAFFTNTLNVQADVLASEAEGWKNRSQWDVSFRLYRQAIEFAPQEDTYHNLLGRAYFDAASNATDQTRQSKLLSLAVAELKVAQALNPLNPEHSANLSRMFQFWAQATPNAEEASSYLNSADTYYALALTLSPNDVSLWNEWARFDVAFRHNDVSALEKLNRALLLNSEFSDTYVGLAELFLEKGDKAKALDYANQALAAVPEADKASVQALIEKIGK